jgi:hypothetical protein
MSQQTLQTQQKPAQPAFSQSSILQRAAITPVHSPVLQRCSNGIECTECREKRLGTLQRAAVNAAPANAVPPIVHDVLNSSGRPLDAGTRAFMEPRFGHDFSGVRVHTDAKAAESAQAVNALAYTVGRDVVFGAGQYAPGTSEGKRLMAHELTHVVQQREGIGRLENLSHPSDPQEQVADRIAQMVIRGESMTDKSIAQAQSATPTVFRRVVPGLVDCPAGGNGAPANSVAELTNADTRAENAATNISINLANLSFLMNSGLPHPDTVVYRAYERRFGLPPARGRGFLNRLTGVVRPTQNRAIGEELGLLARRFELISRLFRDSIRYRCNAGAGVFGGCNVAACGGDFARACLGVYAIFLCRPFWDHRSVEQRAVILIHEATHIIWGRVDDDPVAGPGSNFRIADCYGSFAADCIGTTNPDELCPGVMGDYPIMKTHDSLA